jgi:hypothetical protein
MELRKTTTIIALRTTMRLAWGMERAARALGGIGLALEVLEPLTAAKF